jgi:hypothetical protein
MILSYHTDRNGWKQAEMAGNETGITGWKSAMNAAESQKTGHHRFCIAPMMEWTDSVESRVNQALLKSGDAL